MRYARLPHFAVLQPDTQHGRKLVREDAVALLVGEAAHTRGEVELHGVLDVLVREVVQGDTEATASDERGRDGERAAELGGVTRFRTRLLVFGLGDRAQDRAGDAQLYLFDFLDIEALLAQRYRRVYPGVGEVVRGVGLEEGPCHLPLFSESSRQRFGVCSIVEICLQKAEPAFEGRRRSGQAAGGELGGGDAGVGGPAAVYALDRPSGAVRLDDTRAHARRDRYGVTDLLFPEPVDHRRSECSTEGPGDGGGVQTFLEEDRVAQSRVVAGHADAHDQLISGGDGGEEVPARSP